MNETRELKTTSLSEAVSCVAWGYVFLHLDFNLGGINVLPDWGCYALVLHALPGLAKAERSALLLRPLAVILLAVDALMWGLQIFGVAPDLYIVSALCTVLELYFHFQLLTNVADIARIDPQRSRSVLRLRNFRTVFVTLLALPWQPEAMSWSARDVYLLVTRFAAVVLIIWTFSALFDVKNHVILGADGEESLPEREP